jgi:hypothetical protein
LDAAPTSVSSDVKVNISKPNLKEDKSVSMTESGHLKWVVKLGSGKTVSVQTIYQVEAPIKVEVYLAQ